MKILILGAGEMQVPIIKKVKELGYTSIVLDYDPDAIGSTYADFFHVISTLDIENVLNIAKKYCIDGIVTTSDMPVKTLSHVCENIGLKGVSSYAAEVCTNKYAQRELLAKLSNNFLTPKYMIISDIESLKENINKFEFPIIIKPVDSSASRGVIKVHNNTELEDAYTFSLQHSRTKNIIIEEFIDGKEYSIESLTQNEETFVVAITEKTLYETDGDCFVESRHILPADLNKAESNALINFVKSLCLLIGINNSATHTEVKVNHKGIYLIEIAARLGGDFITSDLIPLATGIDMLKNIIYLALDKPINKERSQNMYAGIQFIDSASYNDAQEYIAKNKHKINKYDVKPFKQQVVNNSLDRLGHLTASHQSRYELLNILNLGKINP